MRCCRREQLCWLTVCFVALYACACPLKDDSSQACLDHAVHMINRERWSWYFIAGSTVTPQLPCGTTALGFVLEQTAVNNVLINFGWEAWWEEASGRGRDSPTFEQSKTQDPIDPVFWKFWQRSRSKRAGFQFYVLKWTTQKYKEKITIHNQRYCVITV